MIEDMKKMLLFALPLMVMCFVSCEKSENSTPGDEWKDSWTDDSPIIQFKDPKFLNALLEITYSDGYYPIVPIDRNGDGQITEKEASVTTEIMLYETGIRNMDEIKYFISLTYLSLEGNELTSLDLSNNIALTHLIFGGTQISTLDVSKNTALKELVCGNSQLTALDLSNNTALEYLSCHGNQLTAFDVGNNLSLAELYCGENQLTSLDVSKNTALTRLDCSNNQLKTLDLSKNTSLTFLSCSNNPSLNKIILYKYHIIEDEYLQDITEEYGDIIEYVE